MVSGAMNTLRPMAYAWTGCPSERCFSVKRALAPDWTGPRVLMVQSHPEFEVLSTSVCGGVLRRVCQQVAAPGEGSRPQVSMVLDEFYSLRRIDGIERSLSVAREQGMATVIALQSMWQLRDVYGETAELLSDLFQIKIYGRHTPGEAANGVVRDLGTRSIEGTKINRLAESRDTRKIIAFEQDKCSFGHL